MLFTFISEFDANAPGTSDIEAYLDYISNRTRNEGSEQGQDEHGEFIFTRSNEGIEQTNVDDYDDSDEDSDEADNTVIVISSDDEDEEERTNFNTYRRMMGALSERSTLFSSIISRTISTATATLTTTTITSSALSTTTTPTTITATTRTPLQRCCICLTNILTREEGINLHDNIHSIHIFCLMDLLAANSQIIWLETSFRFDCPLCRKPVFGAVMMIS